MGENGTFYFECYFNLLACLFNPALICILNVDVDADKSVSNNNNPPPPLCLSSKSLFCQICVSDCRELHFLSAVWSRHVLLPPPPPSYLYKSLTNPCSQEEAVHVLFSHAARLTPGGKSLKTATTLQSSHKSLTAENIRSNIEHVGLWGWGRTLLDSWGCCCVFVAADVVTLLWCSAAFQIPLHAPLFRTRTMNRPPLRAQHQQDAHEQEFTKK